MNIQSSLSQTLSTNESPFSSFPSAAQNASGSAYAELKQLVKSKGLLGKQPAYYLSRIVLLSSALLVGILVLLLIHILWVQLLDAVYLALVSTQIGLLSHEAGHHQMFHRSWKHDAPYWEAERSRLLSPGQRGSGVEIVLLVENIDAVYYQAQQAQADIELRPI